MITKKTKLVRLFAFGIMLVSAGLLAGCSSDNNDSGTNPGESQGEVKIHMVDAPAAFDAVNIVVTEVSVHQADEDSMSGWQRVREDTATYNLLELRNGASTVLGDTMLAAGHYNQIRLKIGEGSNVVVAGQTFPLVISSGAQTGIKLNHQFTIEGGATYELTLDFDAERSIHTTGTGTFMLRPTIRVVATMTSGWISGVVQPVDAHASIMAVSADSDTVTALADTTDGSFTLMAVPEGTYNLTVSATQGNYLDTTIEGVDVTARETTNIGTVTLVNGGL